MEEEANTLAICFRAAPIGRYIQTNPGSVQRPCVACVACSSPVTTLGIQCDMCDGWCHPGCANVDSLEYERLGGCDDS